MGSPRCRRRLDPDAQGARGGAQARFRQLAAGRPEVVPPTLQSEGALKQAELLPSRFQPRRSEGPARCRPEESSGRPSKVGVALVGVGSKALNYLRVLRGRDAPGLPDHDAPSTFLDLFSQPVEVLAGLGVGGEGPHGVVKQDRAQA